VAVTALRRLTAAQVRAAVDAFAPSYVRDWDLWLATPAGRRLEVFGAILRRWQATRPRPMRRPRLEADHPAPFLDDLVAAAAEPLSAISGLTLATVRERSLMQDRAFARLWEVFGALTTHGSASAVGISKAVLLLTDGRIGPALDSRVRTNTGVAAPRDHREWMRVLEEIAEDLASFERTNAPIPSVVSPRFAHLGVGRLYDMALGPR
jgi:hypothetical protein